MHPEPAVEQILGCIARPRGRGQCTPLMSSVGLGYEHPAHNRLNNRGVRLVVFNYIGPGTEGPHFARPSHATGSRLSHVRLIARSSPMSRRWPALDSGAKLVSPVAAIATQKAETTS